LPVQVIFRLRPPQGAYSHRGASSSKIGSYCRDVSLRSLEDQCNRESSDCKDGRFVQGGSLGGLSYALSSVQLLVFADTLSVPILLTRKKGVPWRKRNGRTPRGERRRRAERSGAGERRNSRKTRRRQSSWRCGTGSNLPPRLPNTSRQATG